LELDNIDNLAHPTTSNLIVLVGGGYLKELRKGPVYPNLARLDDVPIDSASFTVVKVDIVYENMKNLKLKVSSDDTTLTLQDAFTRRVQWRRTFIDVDPAAASASTTPSQTQSSPLSLIPTDHM
jgi:hypothetical protein